MAATVASADDVDPEAEGSVDSWVDAGLPPPPRRRGPGVLSSFAGGALFGERRGDAPLEVLALHGWGRTHADFARALAGCGPSVALDLPGFGASPSTGTAMGSADFARCILPVLDEASAPVVVVGHSHGGRVAVCLAALAPEKVAGLVLVGAPVLRRSGAARPSAALRMLKVLRRLHLVSEGRLESYRRSHGSADYRAAEGTMRSTLVRVINESFEPELAGLRCPVVLLWGADDADVPVEVAERAAGLIGTEAPARPSVELEVLPGVGHLVPTQAPEALAAAIGRVRA
jgi:pimeloyl-ACP methyl ester carboxylesterase